MIDDTLEPGVVTVDGGEYDEGEVADEATEGCLSRLK